VLTTSGKTISGWLLHSLQRLSMYPPAQTQARVCGGGERNGVIPLAVTTRNIYVRALCGSQTVWVASLPPPSGTIGGSLIVSGAARRPGHCGCAHEAGVVVITAQQGQRHRISVGRSGRFAIRLPVGRYRAVGGIPSLGWKLGTCYVDHPLPPAWIDLRANRITQIVVDCHGH
jgi:hypothetical protein